MKRSVGASFSVMFLLFVCLEQNGVKAHDVSIGTEERATEPYFNPNTARTSHNAVGERGGMHEGTTNEEKSATHQAYPVTRSGEKRAAHKPPVNSKTATTTTTNTDPRTDERNDGNHGRTDGGDITVDDRNSHQPTGDEAMERSETQGYPTDTRANGANADGGQPRSHDRGSDGATTDCRHGVKCERGDGTVTTYSRTEDTTLSQDRTQGNGDVHDRHGHNERAHEHIGTKTQSSGAEERTGGEEEVPVQTKAQPHPIGLLNERTDGRPQPKAPSSSNVEEEVRAGGEERPVKARSEAKPIGLIDGLDGRVKQGRSIEKIEARQLDSTTAIIAAALVGFATLVFILFCIAEVAKKRREKKADSTRLLRVFQYLHEFNVDDIDIQLSAAGGFHVGYLNGLAQGINTKKQSDQKTETSDEEENGSLSKKV